MCYSWLKITTVLRQSPFTHFMQHVHYDGSKLTTEKWKIIWRAVIWRQRSECIFKNRMFDFDTVVQQIVYLAWAWLKSYCSFEYSFTQVNHEVLKISC